jgi:hypothetical protein
MAFLGLTGRAALALALVLSGSAARGAAAGQSQGTSSSGAGSSQGGSSQAESTQRPSDLDRVKRALELPSSGILESVKKKTERVDDTTFRVQVIEKSLDIWDFWGAIPSPVAPYVGSWYFSNWHHEFLRMVTPDYARRAALFPQGMVSVSVLPDLANAVKNALRVRAERAAKKEVEEALEEFFRQHPEARHPAPSPPRDTPPG